MDDNIRKGISMGEIVSLMRQRRSQDSILIRQMIEVRDRFNGDVVLPVPDVPSNPTMEPPVPRLIAQAIDGTAMQASGPKPSIACPNMGTTVKAYKNADLRRRMLYAKWWESQVDIKLYRSYRHLCGYGTNAWLVMPDDDSKTGRIELRDPLTTYPELRSPDDIREPKNVGFIFGRSIEWICAKYPNAKGFFNNAASQNWDTLWDVVEWIDEDEIVIGILGPRMPAYSPQDSRPYAYNGFELERFQNKAGMVPVVVPRRVTLDRIQGQMSTMLGSVDLHARMTALELLAAEKHVFPDLVLMSEANATATLVSGGWRSGATGEANVVQNARDVKFLTSETPPFIPQMVENLEQAIRESGGASGMFGGDNSNMRTGRGLAQLGSFSIDPRVEELQRIQSRALSCVGEAVIAVEKGYYPRSKHFAFTGLPGEYSTVEYSPSDLDSGMNAVSYPIPGADVSQMTVAIAQNVGSGLESKRSGRIKHPFIDDPDQEEKQIAIEGVETALLASVQQAANSGQMAPPDIASYLNKLRAGVNVEDAYLQVHNEAQARQATPAQPPGPGQVLPPQNQPGVAPPGAPGQPPPGGPAIPPAPLSLQDLHGLTRNLSAPPQSQPTGGLTS